ncbi:MAG: hypothetical protein JSS24_17220 [Proteobacteria bacterium]|nr:hypothetical protein [Pseudomonadota bacterium]
MSALRPIHRGLAAAALFFLAYPGIGHVRAMGTGYEWGAPVSFTAIRAEH